MHMATCGKLLQFVCSLFLKIYASNNQPPSEGSDDSWRVTRHINLSSHFDDDDDRLIKSSTQLGYRNPPETKIQGIIPSNSQPMMDPMVYPPVTSDLMGCGYHPFIHHCLHSYLHHLTGITSLMIKFIQVKASIPIYLQKVTTSIAILSCPKHQHILVTLLQLVDQSHCQVWVVVMDQSPLPSLNLYPIKSTDKDTHLMVTDY